MVGAIPWMAPLSLPSLFDPAREGGHCDLVWVCEELDSNMGSVGWHTDLDPQLG